MALRRRLSLVQFEVVVYGVIEVISSVYLYTKPVERKAR